MMENGLTDEQGDGYFASISDLMVGVLFVFLLMLTIFALNFRDDSARLDELIRRVAQAELQAKQAQQKAENAEQEAKRETEAANRLRAQNVALKQRLGEAAAALQRELQDREAVRAVLLQRLAEGLQQRGIRFLVDQRSGVLRLSDSVPFAIGRSDLTDTTRRTLQALAEVLAATLPCFAQGGGDQGCDGKFLPVLETVLVEGHTDRQAYPSMTPAQSRQENDRLSTERALTVFAELRQQKPMLEALRNPSGEPLFGVSGYGERRPLPDALSSDEADLKRNRRIDLRFVLSARTSDELRQLLADIAALQAQGEP